MANDITPQSSLFSQVLVGVVVSLLTAVTLKSLGVTESQSPAPAQIAPPAATVRISFASPESAIVLPPPEELLFNCRQKTSAPHYGFVSASPSLPIP